MFRKISQALLFLSPVFIFAACDPMLGEPSALADSVAAFLVAHAGAASSALGVLLVIVAKLFPNANSTGVIRVVQVMVDAVAKLIVKVGGLVQKLADILSEALKSDGFLGKP